MKKITILTLCLIGLGMSQKLFAQNDLVASNTTACTFNLTITQVDNSTCSSCSPTTTYSLSTTAAPITITSAAPCNYVYKVFVDDGCGNTTSLKDQTLCGGTAVLTGTIPSSACCYNSGNTINVSFNLVTGGNSQLSIN